MDQPKEFVLDCSMALAWCFPDEFAPSPKSAMDALAVDRAVVPSLWPLEIVNAFLNGERRGRCTTVDTSNWIAFLKKRCRSRSTLRRPTAFGATAYISAGSGVCRVTRPLTSNSPFVAASL